MRYVTYICKVNLLRWKSSIRIIIMFILLVAMQVMLTLPYIQAVNYFSYPIQIFESYIVSFINKYSSLLLSIIMVFIITDVPIRNKGFENLLFKGTKNNWLLAQWIYIALCGFIFCLTILVINMLLVSNTSFLSNEWSIPTIRLAKNPNIINNVTVFSIVPERVMSLELPNIAALWTFVLQWLLFVFFGVLMSLFNILGSSISAPVVLIILNGINWAMRMFMPEDETYALLSWFSPIYHGTYSEHQFRSVYLNNMASPAQSALILFLLILVMIFISHFILKRVDILNSIGVDYDE